MVWTAAGSATSGSVETAYSATTVSPFVSVWSYLYDGVFVGATRAREMRDIMVGSAVLVFLPSWYVLQPLGNHGLWLAFIFFMAGRGIGMHIYYRRRVIARFATTTD